MDLSDGVMRVNQTSESKRFLATHINDNVYKNIKRFSVTSFDSEQKFSKDSFTINQKD